MTSSFAERALLAVLAGMLGAGAFAGEAAAEKRFFTVAAVEPKGGANVSQEKFPTEALPPGGGYVIKRPDEAGRWEVSTYVWMPGQIVVNQGDEVNLEFIGINGANHPTTISGFGKSFVLNRGNVTRVTFTADKVGRFPIVCATHKPSMVGELIVLAKN